MRTLAQAGRRRLAHESCHSECNEACPEPVEGSLAERPVLSPSTILRSNLSFRPRFLPFEYEKILRTTLLELYIPEGALLSFTAEIT